MEIFSVLELCFHHIKEYWNGIATDTCINKQTADIYSHLRNTVSYWYVVKERL